MLYYSHYRSQLRIKFGARLSMPSWVAHSATQSGGRLEMRNVDKSPVLQQNSMVLIAPFDKMKIFTKPSPFEAQWLSFSILQKSSLQFYRK